MVDGLLTTLDGRRQVRAPWWSSAGAALPGRGDGEGACDGRRSPPGRSAAGRCRRRSEHRRRRPRRAGRRRTGESANRRSGSGSSRSSSSPARGATPWDGPATISAARPSTTSRGVEQHDSAAILVTAHLHSPGGRKHVLVRTLVPADRRRLPSATGLFQVALRHERETYESVGVLFTRQPDQRPLPVPDGDEDPCARSVTEVRPVRSLRPAGAGRAPGSGTSRPAVPTRPRPPGTPPLRTRGPA